METAAGLEKNRTRDSNFELLRITSMLMIVALHYLARTEALTQNTTFGLNWFFSWTVEALCIVSVNCYVLISGYFLITSRFRIKKLIRLWTQVLFYSITIYLILTAVGLEQFTIKHLALSCIPVLTNQYWFVSVYLALYIVSPFLNVFIHALSRKQFQNLLIILFVTLCVWPTVLPFGLSLDKTNGYSIIQFVFLYFIASYIRLFWNYEFRKRFYLSAYALITLMITASKIVFTSLGFNNISGMFYEFNSVTVVLSSVMLFMYFRSVSVKNAFLNRVTCSVSALTFGVYLIHEEMFLRNILYKKILHADLYLNTPQFIPAAILIISGIFTACLLIDAIRKKIFTVLENSRLLELISSLAAKSYSIMQKKLSLIPSAISNK